jgi:ferredoxin--NADP+ reductase
MLALTPDELAPTDATDKAIAAIGSSKLKEIVMLGRRGPAQAAFTTPELQELGELAGADILVDPAELELDDASEAALAGDTNARRNVEVLGKFAGRAPTGKPRAIRLRFLVSPVAILGEERVEAIEVERNRLAPDGRGSLRAEPTGERETIECGLVFRSVGYRGVALPEVPFDEGRGTILNEGGRVVGEDGEVVPGVYAAGWIKRGPTGVIGTNKKDAVETVGLLLEDHQAGRLERRAGATAEAVEALLAERGASPVLYEGWTSIDQIEKAAGEPHGRPRAKLVTWDDLLDAAAERVPAS